MGVYTISVPFNHTLHHEATIWQYGIVDIFLLQGKDQQTNLSPGLNHRSKPSLNRSFNCSFNEHYNDAALSDVTLKAGDCQVHAHRIVLAAQSPWFKAMFQVQLLALITCHGMSVRPYPSLAYSDMTRMMGMPLYPCYVSNIDMSTYLGCMLLSIRSMSILLLGLLSCHEVCAHQKIPVQLKRM